MKFCIGDAYTVVVWMSLGVFVLLHNNQDPKHHRVSITGNSI